MKQLIKRVVLTILYALIIFGVMALAAIGIERFGKYASHSHALIVIMTWLSMAVVIAMPIAMIVAVIIFCWSLTKPRRKG